jgi:hypothetical protein
LDSAPKVKDALADKHAPVRLFMYYLQRTDADVESRAMALSEGRFFHV